jgi:serine/threonine protein kinase
LRRGNFFARLLLKTKQKDAKCYEVWVVLEFLEYGALTETLTTLDMKEPDIAYVCKVRKTRKEFCVQNYAQELTAALSWLHSRNCIHRDIKSDNILLGSEGQVKLADFGLAVELVKV